jgi:hypothetical protein
MYAKVSAILRKRCWPLMWTSKGTVETLTFVQSWGLYDNSRTGDSSVITLRTAISISTQNKLLLPRSHPHRRANQRASTLLLPACCEAQPGHHVRQHDSLSERPPSPRSCRNSATSARHMSSQMTPTIAESAVIGLVCMAVVDAWCVTHSEADTIAQINPLKHAIALR